jgi:hypothetical protein
MAKKCPVPKPRWIMVNVNDLTERVRSLILLKYFGRRVGDGD